MKYFHPLHASTQTQVDHCAPTILVRAQHDSQELLVFLLNGLHEDLNLVKQKPDINMTVKTEGKDDKVREPPAVPFLSACMIMGVIDFMVGKCLCFQDIAEESWHKYLQRNQSVIVRVFQGQLKSTITCPACKLVRN